MDTYNLPAQLTPFIGRVEEVAEITRLLADPACRLLTLVGPGGIGKTRLALEAARQVTFPNGVHFVALQPLLSSDFMVPTIADAVGFQFYPGTEPKQQLLNFFREKSILLIMDNLEQLLDGVHLLSEILINAPAVHIVATSRERLNLVEEWALEVRGLSFPASETEPEIEYYSAVQLFVQNARRVQVGFSLSDEYKPAVTRICRLVEGMPLGIELASAWVRVMPCAEIAHEVEHSLDILTTTTRNVPEKHRSMRAVFDTSWKLLTEDEQAVFRKLSAFRGGFTREAAEQIVGATLAILASLVDKSLLRVDANGRYEIHELLRQHAQEKLESVSVEREQTLDLHSAYYAEFMGRRKSDLRGSRMIIARREIEDEIDNIRKAWERAITQPRPIEVEKYLWSLFLFYDMLGWLLEGEESFEKAAQAFEMVTHDQEKERVLGQLYARQAFFSGRLGYYEKGKDLLLTSLAILRPLEARQEMVFSLLSLGAVCIYRAEYSEAEAALREATAINRERDNPYELAWSLRNQAKLLRTQGNHDRARQIMQECITLCRECGMLDLLAESLTEFGQIMEALANYQEARQSYQEALTIYQDLPFSLVVANCTIYLGRIAHALHEDDEAAFYYHKALEVSKHIGSFRLKVGVLLGMTELQMKQGEKKRNVERLILIVHHPASLSETKNRAQVLLDKLESELPPQVFAAGQEKGKAAKLDETLESMYETPLFSRFRAADSNVYVVAAKHRASGYVESDLLTERELEILHLMAQGMSNRDIAERLILAVGTVKWYGSQICSKLQAQNRVQAIARARELNILL